MDLSNINITLSEYIEDKLAEIQEERTFLRAIEKVLGRNVDTDGISIGYLSERLDDCSIKTTEDLLNSNIPGEFSIYIPVKKKAGMFNTGFWGQYHKKARAVEKWLNSGVLDVLDRDVPGLTYISELEDNYIIERGNTPCYKVFSNFAGIKEIEKFLNTYGKTLK